MFAVAFDIILGIEYIQEIGNLWDDFYLIMIVAAYTCG